VTRAAAVVILVGLAVSLAVGIAPNASSRIVDLGQRIWPGYAAELRVDPTRPTCDLQALKKRLSACPAKDAAPAPAPSPSNPFGGKDPFASGGPATAPAAQENCPALRSLVRDCEQETTQYEAASARITPNLRRFRAVDQLVGGLARFPWWRDLLSVLLLVGGLATTFTRMHIALRSARTLLEDRVTQSAQLAAHLFLFASSVADWHVQATSTARLEDLELPILWAVGFAALALVNLWHLLRPPRFERGDTNLGRLLMVIPLYAYMAVIAGLYFLLAEAHPSGQAIYLHKFVQHPTVYVGIGLYIWAGMLLAETWVAHRAFRVIRPWNLPPPLFAWLVVVISAVPTAYSGASGIFVIAAGAVIFEQLREAGASKRLALATTAMSGSLGVVLRPCLVVVLIAVLNKQVTTDQLFAQGHKVFLLTAALYLGAMLIYSRGRISFAPPHEAAPKSLRALGPLVPYLLIGAVILVFYRFAFDTGLNERTAPYVLPVLLVPLVAWDRLRPPTDATEQAFVASHGRGLFTALVEATETCSHHVGALLMVMAGSVGLGGVVERADLMRLVPASLGSLPVTMTVLVVILILVGMTMDAMGAVILVSVTIAQIAYKNGVNPVHFWMTVLVAFELGYLTLPVALNHLLARQVIGAGAELDDDVEGFWARTEHQWLPMAVMGAALLLVAYVPLAWYPLGS